MLYMPPAFKVEDLAVLHDHVARTGFATLITSGRDGAGPLVSHVPLILDPDAGPLGTLTGHLARANPHWQAADLEQPAVAVFHGPDTYISPGWYPSKAEHGRVVPTWNYAVVHARGRLEIFDDEVRLRDAVDRLTNRHEATRAQPWQTSDAPERFMAGQLKGIVGMTLAIESLEGKYKLSQNRSESDREGVVAGLAGETAPGAAGVRGMMQGD